jgi:acyl-CoA dehydrogenase
MARELDDPDLFSFDESYPSLAYLARHEPRLIAKVRDVFEDNRSFCREHVAPLALSTDLALQRDPGALAEELLSLAITHRRFSRFVPRMLGGLGDGTLIAPIVSAEEIAAVDPGFVGVLSGHGLGMVALGYTMNLRALDAFGERTVRCEQGGPRFLIDCAITEPSAGTDVEETALITHADLQCEAKRVEGGALLRGRKCFISGGHFATHHLVIMPFDRKDPLGTTSVFLVRGDSPGFSLGKLENKMGQKAGPASELVFDDCFVPTEDIVLDAEKHDGVPLESLLHGVLGATRIYVGAWATGIGRGAFEIALRFAKTHKWRGKTLIQHQFAQRALVDMLINVHQARSVYVDAMFALMNANGGAGAPEVASTGLFRALYHSYPVRRVRHSERVQRALLRRVGRRTRESSRVQFFSSLAKVVGSDLAMDNCHRALDLMGAVGARHDAGAEKLFRDAKLCQIFEGTNQLNRLHMLQHSVAARVGMEVF